MSDTAAVRRASGGWDAVLADGGWTVSDGFSVLAAGRWTFTDEQPAATPSAWSAGGGALTQTVASTDAAYATAGVPAPADGRVAAVVQSPGHGRIGIVTRFTDAANLYRLALDVPGKQVVLEKVVGGVATELWSAPLSWRADHPYLLTLGAVGARLAAWLDGELLIAVEDGELTAG